MSVPISAALITEWTPHLTSIERYGLNYTIKLHQVIQYCVFFLKCLKHSSSFSFECIHSACSDNQATVSVPHCVLGWCCLEWTGICFVDIWTFSERPKYLSFWGFQAGPGASVVPVVWMTAAQNKSLMFLSWRMSPWAVDCPNRNANSLIH